LREVGADRAGCAREERCDRLAARAQRSARVEQALQLALRRALAEERLDRQRADVDLAVGARRMLREVDRSLAGDASGANRERGAGDAEGSVHEGGGE